MADLRIYVANSDSGRAGWFDASGDLSKHDIQLMALEELRISEDEEDGVLYIIQEVDSFDVDAETTSDVIAELASSKYGASEVLAALEAYHNDPEDALILLKGGYYVYSDEDEIVDEFLDRYGLDSVIERMIDREKALKYAKSDRTLIESPTGAIVEFYR